MTHRTRRSVLQTAGILPIAALSGCLSGHDGHDGHDVVGARDPTSWCLDELDDSVPPEYARAESIDGIQRDPGDLVTKDAAGYRCGATNFQLCANCQYFVPTQGSDMIGACTEVGGEIRSQDWCGLWAPTERLGGQPVVTYRDR